MRNTDTSVSAHSRAIRRVLSCSAVAATLLGAMTLTAATQAHADSGRRVCVYAIDTVDPKAPNENVIWGVNYKKDGAMISLPLPTRRNPPTAVFRLAWDRRGKAPISYGKKLGFRTFGESAFGSCW